ncbi:MAG: pyridoxal-phosphate dependent enzyme [Halobacteriales archaeon]
MHCDEIQEDAVCDCGCPVVPDAAGVDVEPRSPGAEHLYDTGDASVYLWSEGRQPGGVYARGMAAAFSVVDAPAVSLASTGDSAVAAAATAAEHDVDLSVYLPERAPYHAKALVNVHGGDLRVVRGGYTDAVDAAKAGDSLLTPESAPARIHGGRSLARDIAASEVDVDAVVLPRGETDVAAGVAYELDVPLHVVEPTGSKSLARAVDAGETLDVDVDTVIGYSAVDRLPAPTTEYLLRAHAEDDVVLHAVDDGDALDECIEVARSTGALASPAGGLALRVARSLSGDVLAVDPVSAVGRADVLRNRLVYHGE